MSISASNFNAIDPMFVNAALGNFHLSAASTLVGAGVLIFADHPARASIGTTLTAGVTTGYLVAITAVPALHRLAHTREEAVSP